MTLPEWKDPETLVRLHEVSLSFTNTTRNGVTTSSKVLESISFELKRGTFTCLLGPSGCGKSTVLNLVAGFEKPTSGSLSFKGQPITAPGPERGMVFQQPTLFPWLSVKENLTLAPRLAKQPASVFSPLADRYLQLTGLTDFAHHAPWQLSGGMRQRVALARAWIAQPEVLLMDEPFGALDAQTRLTMQILLKKIWHATGTTILFVTHDVDEALFLAEQVWVMSTRPGRISKTFRLPFGQTQDPEEVIAHPTYGAIKQDILHCVRQAVMKGNLTEANS